MNERLTTDGLIQKRSRLLLQRKKLLLQIKDAKSALLKKVLSKRLKETNYQLDKVETEIKRRKASVVKKGTTIKRYPSPIKQPKVRMFAPSSSSSFNPSVEPQADLLLPTFSKEIPKVKAPSFVPSPMPSFVQPVVPAPLDMPKMELPAIADEIIEEQDIIESADLDTQTDGFDYVAFLYDNKLMIGAGLLVGLYFVFGHKPKKAKSNPRRTKRKSRKVRKARRVRRNSAGARRGYKRH